MTVKHVLLIISKYRDDWYKPPTSYKQKRVDFEYQSFKRSACEELILYLSSHSDQNPISAIEDFRHMMDDFACRSKTSSANFMFSVYYDVATDLLDVMIMQ